ncbi:MAG: Protein FdhD-like protein, partial [Candidatus Nomurabacteria bacterium GW2011_GWA2_40_9]
MKKELEITRIREKRERLVDVVVEELPLTIFLNGEELATLLCSPNDLKYLVIGFLYNEGIIKGVKDIKELRINKDKGISNVKIRNLDKNLKDVFQRRVITSGCSGFYNPSDLKLKKIKSNFKIKKEKINELMQELMKTSAVFKET